MAGGGVNRVPAQAASGSTVQVVGNINATVTNTVTVTESVKTLFTNFGTANNPNVKASAGVLFSLCVENRNQAARYCQIHNTNGVVANGTIPVYTFLVPGGTMVVLGEDFFSLAGHAFSNGIAYGFSSTMGTMTAAAAGDSTIHIHYI